MPITSLEVNGQVFPVSGANLCESFTVTQSSPWGMSLIEATAGNAFGRSANLVQSYLRSPDSDPGTLDDLATFAKLGLEALDLRPLVPTTLYSSTVLGCDLLTVTTRGISMGSYDVSAAIEAGGIGTSVIGRNLVWGLRFTYTGCLGGVTSVDGLFLANAVSSGHLVDFAVVGGPGHAGGRCMAHG